MNSDRGIPDVVVRFPCVVCCCVVDRVGEKAIQTFGLAAPSNDANTGDISQPLNSFVHMRDGLKEIQAQVGRSVGVEAHFVWCPRCKQRSLK